MKKTTIAAALLILCLAVQAQDKLVYTSRFGCDTVPVYIVYIDSVRIFADAPVFDERLEVMPGWQTVCYPESRHRYFDTAGREMHEDRVVLTKRRRHKTTKF